MSKARHDRLVKATKADKYPTTQGDRALNTSSGGRLHPPNKFKDKTNAAAQAIKKNRDKYKGE